MPHRDQNGLEQDSPEEWNTIIMASYKKHFWYAGKFDVVAHVLQSAHGQVLDLGARDKVLTHYLNHEQIAYQSHDIDGDHDFVFDLEQDIPLEDGTYDAVLALDVLEHLEHIHTAFAEMMRISNNYVIISLPCMSSLYVRLGFLASGKIAKKYALYPFHQGDRHRWVINYHEAIQFVNVNTQRHGYEITDIYHHLYRYSRRNIWQVLPLLSVIPMMIGTDGGGYLTQTITFVARKN